MKRATLAREQAKANGDRTYSTGLPCKRGHVAERLTSNSTCTQCLPAVRSAWVTGNAKVKASNRRYYEANRERLNAINNAYNAEHRDRLHALGAAYYEQNKGRYRAWSVARKEAVNRATPAWADKVAIEAIYIEAERLTRETGVQHEVDHEYPLRGKLVCGLHVAENLRVLTQEANRKKAAKFDPARGLSGPSAGTTKAMALVDNQLRSSEEQGTHHHE